jgi:hypothetical protein
MVLFTMTWLMIHHSWRKIHRVMPQALAAPCLSTAMPSADGPGG